MWHRCTVAASNGAVAHCSQVKVPLLLSKSCPCAPWPSPLLMASVGTRCFIPSERRSDASWPLLSGFTSVTFNIRKSVFSEGWKQKPQMLFHVICFFLTEDSPKPEARWSCWLQNLTTFGLGTSNAGVTDVRCCCCGCFGYQLLTGTILLYC